MYTKMEQRQKERQNQMRNQAAQGSILEKVQQVRLCFNTLWVCDTKYCMQAHLAYWQRLCC